MRQVIALLLVACSALKAAAQDESAPRTRSSFFDKEYVDFWGDRKAKREKAQAGDTAQRESAFVEPLQLPDGRTVLYAPPARVLAFLESPTRENALEYLKWQKERLKRLREAVEKLAQVSKDDESPQSAPASRVQLLYFKRDGCPACARQDAVLAGLRRTFDVTIVTSDADFQRHGVRSVPTMILKSPDTKKVARLEGLTDKPGLEQAARSLRGRTDSNKEQR